MPSEVILWIVSSYLFEIFDDHKSLAVNIFDKESGDCDNNEKHFNWYLCLVVNCYLFLGKSTIFLFSRIFLISGEICIVSECGKVGIQTAWVDADNHDYKFPGMKQSRLSWEHNVPTDQVNQFLNPLLWFIGYIFIITYHIFSRCIKVSFVIQSFFRFIHALQLGESVSSLKFFLFLSIFVERRRCIV